jgi:hypothetical protein
MVAASGNIKNILASNIYLHKHDEYQDATICIIFFNMEEKLKKLSIAFSRGKVVLVHGLETCARK